MLTACTSPEVASSTQSTQYAKQYVGLQERADRREITALVGVDPVRTEWCAAFINAMLALDDIPGSDSVNSNPLLARSFLDWGDPVHPDEIRRGDIVVFARGNDGWQGHVGFFYEKVEQDGVLYYNVLGGNQNDQVGYELYPTNTLLGIRRFPISRLE